MDEITKEFTVGQLKQWSNKGLTVGKLSVKYDVLNRIGVTNWAPINHNSSITPALAKLIFKFGTKSKLNFRNYVFNQTMKHVGLFIVQLPIYFPSLITDIILKKHP